MKDDLLIYINIIKINMKIFLSINFINKFNNIIY